MNNIKVAKNLTLDKEPYDFAIFGSAIHYIENYQKLVQFFYQSPQPSQKLQVKDIGIHY